MSFLLFARMIGSCATSLITSSGRKRRGQRSQLTLSWHDVVTAGNIPVKRPPEPIEINQRRGIDFLQCVFQLARNLIKLVEVSILLRIGKRRLDQIERAEKGLKRAVDQEHFVRIG